VAGFVSLKPGSGASTLAAQSAFAEHRRSGKSVLLVDLNLASGTSGCWGEGRSGQPDLLQALAHLPELETGEGWQRWTIGRNGVRVLAAPLVPAAEGLGRWSAGLRTLLGMARRQFDLIVVDLPPAAEAGTAALAAGMEQVVAVATPELLSLHLAGRRLKELTEAGTPEKALRVVLNRTSAGDLIPLDKVEELFGQKLAGTVPDDYAALHESGQHGLSAAGALGEAIRRLAAELARRERPEVAVMPRATIATAPMLAAAG
jgi:pilus assembly protein CpaE